MIGSDAREDSEAGDARSDTTIIMHVNEGGTEAYGVSIPRDLYVHVPQYDEAEFYPSTPTRTRSSTRPTPGAASPSPCSPSST